MNDLTTLPKGLPIPVDDGKCDLLIGKTIFNQNIYLRQNDGNYILLDNLLAQDNMVIFIYPMMGVPDTPLPDMWDLIPGARGCTPQACRYNDNLEYILSLGYNVMGLSNQSYNIQKQLSHKYAFKYPLVSDESMKLKDILNLPTFMIENKEYYHRVTLIIDKGVISKFFYPIYPPGSDVTMVIDYIKKLRR